MVTPASREMVAEGDDDDDDEDGDERVQASGCIEIETTKDSNISAPASLGLLYSQIQYHELRKLALPCVWITAGSKAEPPSFPVDFDCRAR